MAPPGQLPRVRSAEASIEKGRAAYADQRFRVALEHFTLVAGNCPCSSPSGGGPTSSGGGSGSSSGGRTSRSLKGLGAAGSRGGGGAGPDGGDASGNGHSPAQQRRRRERCTCRDFAQAAARHRRERGSVYAEATKECKCGAEKTWGRCHREGHVQALDYRAACFEKMGKLDMARRDAEWLLEIAPRRLEVSLGPVICFRTWLRMLSLPYHFARLSYFCAVFHMNNTFSGVHEAGEDIQVGEETRNGVGCVECRYRGWTKGKSHEND